MAGPMTEEQIESALGTLTGWRSTKSGFIRRDFALGDFDAAMNFIHRVADIARALDHHPNLTTVYDRVTLELQTHDCGGVTARDIEFARRVDGLEGV